MYGQSHRAGRSNASPYNSQHAASAMSASRLPYKSSFTDLDQRAGASSLSRSQFGSPARSITTPSMIPGKPPSPSKASMPTPAKTMPNLVQGRLHKRAGSGSGSTIQDGRPSIGDKEPFPELAPTTSRVKPYLRKLSTPKEDQGKLDLSKSLADERWAKDAFMPPGRHARTTSNGSQMSSHSTASKPNSPFVHPMHKAPRPFTPTRAESPYDEEDDDFLDEEHRPVHSFRGKRSMSSSSAPYGLPTPLSKQITIADLGAVPKLTSASQSNLSMVSTNTSKPTGSRRNTDRSDFATSPSSRTSFDRMFTSPGARRSDTDARTRDERIRAARRKFEEKEADKDRKAEKEAMKRREAEAAKEFKRHRARSDASDYDRPQRPGTSGGLAAARTGSALGKYSFRASDEHTSPPLQNTSRFAEKQATAPSRPPPSRKGPGLFAKLFACGSKK